MADTKISALAALTGNNPGAVPTDLLVIVDVTDTSMAASGTDKRITVSDLSLGLGIPGMSILFGAGWAWP
jgi:hypothetical protein